MDTLFRIHPAGNAQVGDVWENPDRERDYPEASPIIYTLETVNDSSYVIGAEMEEVQDSDGVQIGGTISGAAVYDRATGVIKSGSAEGDMVPLSSDPNQEINPALGEFRMTLKMTIQVH